MNKTFQITLSPIQQIVSINDEPTPFNATVTVTSESRAPFDMLITDSAGLEKLGDHTKAQFQRAEEGVLQADVKNENTLWHLLLKSEADNIVNIQINEVENFDAGETPPKKRLNWSLILLIGIGVILLGLFLFSKLFKKADPIAFEDNVPAIDDDFIQRINSLPSL